LRTKEPITQCPKCGGPVWDNRIDKRNPKAPDWKCKDAACGEAVWLEKPKEPGQVSQKANGHVAYTWHDLGRTYKKCYQIATWAMGADMSPEAIQAATATLFIQATRMGLKAEEVDA
jgi:hypothetical protein